jgi:putative oxidoreductase
MEEGKTMSGDLGLLVLRVVIGLIVAAHGSQKLFGWFGGPGLKGATGWLTSLRMRPAAFWALLAGLAEFGGGVLLALGFLTPFAVAGIFSAMLMAIVLAHWPKFWASEGGLEYPLVLLTSALAVGIAGAGAFSLDSSLGIALPAPSTLIVLLVLSVLGIITAMITREPEHDTAAGGQTSPAHS